MLAGANCALFSFQTFQYVRGLKAAEMCAYNENTHGADMDAYT